VSIAPLLWLLHGAGGRRGFALGFAFGIGFFSLLLYWISIIGFLGFVVLVLLQATFIGLFGALWGRWSGRCSVVLRILIPAALWVAIVEYARSLLPVRGFTWGELAQSQHDVLWLLKAASIGGGWAVAFLLLVVSACLVEGVRAAQARGWRPAVACAAVALVALAGPALIPAATADGDPIKVAIVQGNIPREMAPSAAKDRIIINSHVHFTEELPADVDLVVWPESSVGIDPTLDPEVMESIAGAARAAGAPMIVGATLERTDGKYQVMALLISEDGAIIDQYQKTHLVPFGEYVPARRFLDWIPALDQVARDAVAGDEPTVFSVAGGRIAPVVSFEGDFGSLVRGRVAAGGRIVVIATNTSTWEDSWASAQHLAMGEVRAAENGVYIIHAALTGISGFVDPDGDVISSTGLWQPTVLMEEIRFADSVSFYARTGDWVPIACALGSLVWLIFMMTRERRPGTVP
jgi:apolipoprotein N-acyltransferase